MHPFEGFFSSSSSSPSDLTYQVHAKVMTDAVLPALALALGLVRIFAKPLVDFLKGHGVAGGSHQCSIEQLSIRFLRFGARSCALQVIVGF